MSISNLEAAVAYCGAGLAVVPWAYNSTGEKVPRPHKDRDRLTKEAIEAHYKRFPEDNVGILTGALSGVIIIDLDNPAAVRWAQSFLPDTPWKAHTGRDGGMQWGYRCPPGPERIKNARDVFKVKQPGKPVGAGPQVDVRGDGGYVAMPPSLHASGRNYRWDNGGTRAPRPSELPLFNATWLPLNQSQVLEEIDLDDGMIGDMHSARLWLEDQPPCVSGQGGQSQVFLVCCALLRDFALSWEDAWTLLWNYNERCRPPWSEAELAHHLEGAVQRGSNPRGMRNVPYAPKELQALEQAMAGIFAKNRQKPVPTAVDPPPKTPTVAVVAVPPADTPAARSLTHILAAQSTQDFLDLLAAEAAFNPGAVYEPLVIDRLAEAMRQDKPLVVNFQAQVRKYISKAEMLSALKQRNKDKRQALMTPASVTEDEDPDRARVFLNGDDRIVRDNVLEALRASRSVFVSSYRLSYVDSDAKMAILSGGSLRNAVVNLCDIVAPLPRDDGSVGSRPASLPSPVLQMLEDLLPDQLKGLRVVKQIVRTPFLTPTGQLITEPGYNQETGTLLLDCPEMDLDAFPTTALAVDFLREIFQDFPFRSDAEFANYLGALLTPMLRHAYRGTTPWLLIEANTPGAGKSLLAKCIQLIYGYPANTAVLPTEEVSIEKTMLSLLSEARPVILFDNVKTLVDSPTLEAVATASEEYSGRLLGKSEVKTCPVRQLFVVTANNARLSVDSTRRFLRVRLRKDHLTVAIKDAKRFHIPDLEEYIRDNRGLVVSALVRIVTSWVSDQMPVSTDVILIPTFETFSKTVGACVHHAGLTLWATNAEEVSATMQSLDEWLPFAYAWWKEFRNNHVSSRQVYDFAVRKGLLGFTLSMAKDEHAKVSLLGVRLHERRDTPLGDFVLQSEANRRTRSSTYWIEPQPGKLIDDEPEAPTSGKVVH